MFNEYRLDTIVTVCRLPSFLLLSVKVCVERTSHEAIYNRTQGVFAIQRMNVYALYNSYVTCIL